MSTKEDKDYNPLVSIALITYNGDKYIKRQLDSIRSQSYKNIEIIISDDNSSSDFLKIIEEYSKSDSRIKIYTNELPRGFVNNAQNCISKCTGEIIFLCDQDDWWYENKIQKHVEEYKDPKIKWVYNRLVLVNNEEKEFGYLDDTVSNYYDKDRQKILNYTWGSCIAACLTSYRADLLHSVMPIGKNAPGHDSWIQMAIWPSKSFYIKEVLQAYRIHDSNTVGWGKIIEGEEYKNRENEAIRDNIVYLKELYKNKTIKIWKKTFFGIVYILKILRFKIKNHK